MIDLLNIAENGGCSAKLSAKELDKLLLNFPVFHSDNILVDNSLHDDAGVYRISDDTALIFTADFFPPVCSDPYTFGRIAAANSLSDIYAMGGTPLMALNINMYPANLPIEGLSEILRGGNDMARQAGVAIMGGHTIEDATPKYGMAVIGTVHPDRIIKNSGLKIGQRLILTKPIGTSAILSAQKVGLASASHIETVLQSMASLNDLALSVMLPFNPTGGTDVTGFGLAGHSHRLALASNVSIEFEFEKIPLFDGVVDFYEQGCIPGSTFRNREFLGDEIYFSESMKYEERMLLFDAQTSGGLLFGIDPDLANTAIKNLKKAGISACDIGRILKRDHNTVYVK